MFRTKNKIYTKSENLSEKNIRINNTTHNVSEVDLDSDNKCDRDNYILIKSLFSNITKNDLNFERHLKSSIKSMFFGKSNIDNNDENQKTNNYDKDIVIFHGKGENGKSDLVKILCEIIEDSAYFDPVILTQQKLNKSNLKYTKEILKGCRLLIVTETTSDKKINWEIVNDLLNNEEYKFFGKILIVSNMNPDQYVPDEMFDSINLVEFPYQVKKIPQYDISEEICKSALDWFFTVIINHDDTIPEENGQGYPCVIS